MKKVFTVIMVMVVMVFCVIPTHADVVYYENFESYNVNDSASDKFYGGGWKVAEEGSNKFLRSLPNEQQNYPLATKQTFPGNVSLEFITRNTNTAQGLSVALSNAYVEQFNDPGSWFIGMYAQQAESGIGFCSKDSGGVQTCIYAEKLDGTDIKANTWQKVKITLAGSIVQFYVDDLFIGKRDTGQVINPIENYHLSFVSFGQRDIDNILVKTPEPASMLLLGLGLFGLAGLRRRLKK